MENTAKGTELSLWEGVNDEAGSTQSRFMVGVNPPHFDPKCDYYMVHIVKGVKADQSYTCGHGHEIGDVIMASDGNKYRLVTFPEYKELPNS